MSFPRAMRVRLVATNVCEWRPGAQSYLWATDCGALWELAPDNTPGEVGLLYCPNCGGRLKMVPHFGRRQESRDAP